MYTCWQTIPSESFIASIFFQGQNTRLTKFIINFKHLIHCKNSWCYVIDNPVYTFQKVFACDSATVLYQPVMCFYAVEV